jgi:hypothetical protein
MAPVMSEPSLPICVLRNWLKDSQSALGVSPSELETAKERSRDQEMPVMGCAFPMIGSAPRAALRHSNNSSVIALSESKFRQNEETSTESLRAHILC